MTLSAEFERIRREHNAAVANGLIIKARHLARVLDALEAKMDADWHRRCTIAACNCGCCHGCGKEVPE